VVSRALREKAQIAVSRDGDVAKAVQLARQRFEAQPRRELAAWEALQTGWPATSDPEIRRAALNLQWKPEWGEKFRFYANKMVIYNALADMPRARTYAESTIVALKVAPQTRPNEPLNYSILARSHAILGNRAEALAALDKASRLRPLSRDAFTGPVILVQRAITLMILGDHDAAIAQLEELLKMPSFVSRNWLRLHPVLDPLRGNPRFQRLVAGP
jgi:tetratricopeptide (TPR) repeat protein